MKVAPNKHVLERKGELFFPVGQNAPWPRDFGEGTGPYNGSYAINPVNAGAHVEFEETMEGYQQAGLNYFRLLLNPACLDIEFEKVGNYTDRLNYGWEIDNIVEKAEELDLYIHFNMLVHYAFENVSSGGYLNWDWGQEYVAYGYPVSEGSYGYRTKFNLGNNEPEAFFYHPGCRKFYKQKLRYLISRYGYSPHIALFELMSEITNTGGHNDILNLIGSQGQDSLVTVHVSSSYDDSPQYRLNIADWHKEMAQYIKDTLNHKEHLVSVSYGKLPIAPDYSYAIPEVDVISYNRYSDILGGKYQRYVFEADSLFNLFQKPYFHSETGPTTEFGCDNGVTYRKEAWMAAFTGVAGFNMWNGYFGANQYYDDWEQLGKVNSFMNEHSEIAKLLMGDWEAYYLNDVDNIDTAIRQEALYIRGNYINDYGNSEWLTVGVASNLTDNYYTNTNVNTASWCSANLPDIQAQQIPQNFFWNGNYINTGGLQDYTFNWYDYEANFLFTDVFTLQPVMGINHPLSCATNNCIDKTSEIPFTLRWEPSFLGKAANDKAPLYLGIDNRASNSALYSFTVSPNPANDHIRIYCNDPELKECCLLDAKGQLLRILNADELVDGIEISNLAPGIFVILGISNQQGIIYKQRWVKL